MYQSGGGYAIRGGYAYAGARGIWEFFVLSPQFCCEPKTALNNWEKIKAEGLPQANQIIILERRAQALICF